MIFPFGSKDPANAAKRQAKLAHRQKRQLVKKQVKLRQEQMAACRKRSKSIQQQKQKLVHQKKKELLSQQKRIQKKTKNNFRLGALEIIIIAFIALSAPLVAFIISFLSSG
ncbi:MAG: hypothetical protein HC890_03670 [Chloroflexaceae bacterium]|nr:hypothetical protein [Chloroflexaceae bacterium]